MLDQALRHLADKQDNFAYITFTEDYSTFEELNKDGEREGIMIQIDHDHPLVTQDDIDSIAAMIGKGYHIWVQPVRHDKTREIIALEGFYVNQDTLECATYVVVPPGSTMDQLKELKRECALITLPVCIKAEHGEPT